MSNVYPISIEVQTSAYLGYAQAFNNIPFIQQIKIESTELVDLRDVNLILRVRVQGQDICDEVNINIQHFNKYILFDETAFDLSGELRVKFEGAHLANLLRIDSLQPGEIEVELIHAGNQIAKQSHTVMVVPSRFWAWTSNQHRSIANLAAYVLHYHPVINQIVNIARSILAAQNVQDSFEGYQGDAASVERQVYAIYNAMLTLNLGYINPPASWEIKQAMFEQGQAGQIVRTPDQVVEQRQGTCLDTTLLFAAVLEHLQIHPIIFLIPGHAFIGYWRVPKHAPEVVMPISEIVNYIDTDMIGLVETTAFASSKSSFIDSQQQAKFGLVSHRNLQSPQSVIIDVHYARLMYAVLPMPSVVHQPNGEITVINPPKVDYHVTLVGGNKSRSTSIELEKNLPKRVAQWRNQLLDLSLSNRLINFRIERNSYLQFPIQHDQIGLFEDILNVRDINVGYYLDEQWYDVFDAFLSDRGEIHEHQANISALLSKNATVFAHVKPDRYLTTMRKFARTAKNIIDQTGVNQLYLALGSLVWTTESTARTLQSADRRRIENAEGVPASEQPKANTLRPGEIRSPLLLIPITIRPIRKANIYAMSLDDSSPIMPNFSLLEKLSRELKFELPELREPAMDAHGYDIPGLFQSIRQRIAEEDRPFRVDETCAMGFFDFGNYRLWRDLGDNWQHYVKNPLVNHMVHHQNEPFVSTAPIKPVNLDLDELASMLPIPADGSQLEAIRRALSKETFILQGPPGTGKSQTIANLLFAAIRQDMRVLFVTEKSTAAEVVYDRLASITGDQFPEGIETLVLDIHDQDSKPDAVKAQIARALEVSFTGDKSGYEAARRTYEQYVTSLKEYPEQLHKIGRFGYSMYTARDQLLVLPHTPEVPIPHSFFMDCNQTDLHRVTESLKHVYDAVRNLGGATRNPWRFVGRSLTMAHFSSERRHGLREYLNDLYKTINVVTTLERPKQIIADIKTLVELDMLRMVTQPGSIDLSLAQKVAAPEHVSIRQKMREQLAQIHLWGAGTLELQPQAIDVVFRPLFNAIQVAEKSFFFGRERRVQQAKDAVLGYLVRGGFDYYADYDEFLTAISAQQDLLKDLRKNIRLHPHIDVPVTWNPLIAQDIHVLIDALDRYDALAEYVLKPNTSVPQHIQSLVLQCSNEERQHLTRFCELVPMLFREFASDGKLQDEWANGESVVQQVIRSYQQLHIDAAQNDFLLLMRWVRFVESLAVLHEYGLHEFAQGFYQESFDARDAADMFMRSFLTRHIERLRQDASLDIFDGAQFDQNIERFQQSGDKLRTYIAGIAAEEMLALRRDYVRNHSGEVTNLRRELDKRRRQLKVRQLLSMHGETISALMPCTIASPNSIAMLLDVTKRPFDIVIFDEASQIRVTSAICGIGRGEATVIVGDSKQMPPTSVAEKSLFEEDDDEDLLDVVLDEESILTECVTAQVPSMTLTWHYRSADEMLIAFSNTAYYEGKLSAFPSPIVHHDTMSAVKFQRVSGQFIRRTTDPNTLGNIVVPSSTLQKTSRRPSKSDLLNTNPVEARAIYEYVVSLMTNPATQHLSVGILTFNEKQADLIESYILASGANETVMERFAPDYKHHATRGFIKSLETIQGDEADIILFSVAFSKNESGKLPLNFGPLNKLGGERRLNVAVTRARQQVVVFCSFDPEELRAEESSSRGIRDLRDYLMFAKYGAEGSTKTNTSKIIRDRHRDDIAQVFRAQGFDVRTEYGLTEFKIDLVISDTNLPHRNVAILLDGERWFKRTTVLDRDVLPLQILTRKMGWQAVSRIWLPMWLRNPHAEVERIKTLIESMPIDPPVKQDLPVIVDVPAVEPPSEPSESTHTDAEQIAQYQQSMVDLIQQGITIDPELLGDMGYTSVDESLAEPNTNDSTAADEVPHTIVVEEESDDGDTETLPPSPSLESFGRDYTIWQPWEERIVGDASVLNNLTHKSTRQQVISLIHEIINVESPIHQWRLARLVGKAYGYSRMTEDRANSILKLRLGVKRDNEGFLYPIGMEVNEYVYWRAARTDVAYNRQFAEIGLPELANAITYIVDTTPGIRLEALLPATVRLFGGTKVTDGIRTRLSFALNYALRRNRISMRNGQYTVVR
jgi:hypothetical protein